MASKVAKQPLVVPTDTVVPLSQFDNPMPLQRMFIYSTFLFDHVLNVSMLRNGLEALIERDGWRKLGARLRRNPRTGNLEHHIPVRFTEQRPAIKFHHAKYDMARARHPVASKLPSTTPHLPAVMADPNDFESLWFHPDAPAKLGDHLNRDEPQLCLVVASFDDATLVSLSWPHSLCDALGLGELLRAWSLMIRGQHHEVPKPFGDRHDPLAELGLHPTEPYKLEGSQLSWLGLFIYYLRTWLKIVLDKPRSRMIYVPGPYIRCLREKVVRELSDESRSVREEFVSEGDVLSAWWAKINVAHLSGNRSNKLFHLINALGWRPTLSEDLLLAHRPYISNAVGLGSVLIPAKAIAAKPLSYVARQIRQCIVESRQREQIEAYAALWRKSPGKIPPLFGNATMHVITCSNWSKADLLGLDFSAALTAHATTSSTVTEPGRPCYVQSCFRGVQLSDFLAILGRDCRGGYWLTGITSEKHWAIIEEAMTKI
ncbi:Chloramphenicol acetyltransferase-like domain protein [Metarhizium album ARSEF 1941]|uniref:Chloramphenicol acetyltransferase-like domain protein n=1 Tax=Metarhizium album (strain ARSEF 1941) TaxID=1081103 RepID=A0A0B2WQ74_METAS|nr:Chloramphenicol acetyltransferase-like domain protein [Metarhizium album ARSEF 1941]KHN95647.1 Chloramphenicol acetyltransferase-like domain protein [Metarhizium album ARSEF 1941]